MSATARIMAYLGMNPSDFNRGVDQAHTKVRGFEGVLSGMKGKLAAAFSVGVIAKIGKDIVNQASELIHSAENLRITTDEYQALASAAKRLGLEEADLDAALQKTMRAQEEAASANGSKEMIENFEALGISLNDLDTLNPARIFERMAQSAQKGSTEMAAMIGIIGRAGPRFRSLAEEVASNGLGEMITKAREAGKIIGEEELAAMHEAELAVQSKLSQAKKFGGRVIGGVIKMATGAGVGEESKGRADMSAANEAARQKALDAKADEIALQNDEKRRELEFDKLSATEQRARLEKEIADLTEEIARPDRGRYEKALLERDRIEAERKLMGIGDEKKIGTAATPVDQFRRIGANVFGGTTVDNTAKKSLTVQEKMLVEMKAVRMAAEKAKNGVF